MYMYTFALRYTDNVGMTWKLMYLHIYMTTTLCMCLYAFCELFPLGDILIRIVPGMTDGNLIYVKYKALLF